jgi:hypothetical protein
VIRPVSNPLLSTCGHWENTVVLKCRHPHCVALSFYLMSLWRSPVELLHSHTSTQSHWSRGSTVCFPPRGQRLASWGCTHTSGTGILLLALSRYTRGLRPIRIWGSHFPCFLLVNVLLFQVSNDDRSPSCNGRWLVLHLLSSKAYRINPPEFMKQLL